jgi:uncharacterized protein YjbI with pentapeptide repeats
MIFKTYTDDPMAHIYIWYNIKTDIELVQLYKEGRRDFSDYKDYQIRNIKKIPGNIEEKNAELCNQDLRGIILSGSNLDHANLQGTDLSDAILKGTNLKAAKLQNTNLSRADLSGSDLYSAYLENAKLIDARLRGVKNLRGAKLKNTDFSGADLTNACLDGTIFKDVIINNDTKIDKKYYLIWEIFNEEVIGRNLSGVDLTGAWLEGANLTKVNLSNAKLHEVWVKNASRIHNRPLATRLKGAILTEANLENANLRKADLRDAKLIGANLRGADFTEADLRGADLTGANLRGANLIRCRIWTTNFSKVDFSNTDLTNTKTKLTGAKLKGAYYNDETKFPEGFDPTTQKMVKSNYQNPAWIKDLLNNKGKPQKSPPPRPGQQEFKEELKEKYGYKCVISGCKIEEIIEAAHIIPYSKIESHNVANGLLLRVDLHRLFDKYLLAIHPKTREVLISEQIAKDYQDFIGIKIESRLTGEDANRQEDALRYHYEQCNWIDKQLLE